MFSILALVLSLFGADPAAAQGCGQQNPNCIVPTAPVGTSNGQAASTEFVNTAIGGAPIVPSPLTKTDDTNVTVTLGGTPATALLQPVSLTFGWAGTLSVARGGTGIGSGTSGGIPYFNSATTIASSGVLGANQLVLGGGAGVSPATLGSLGTTTTVLHGNAGGLPSFGSLANADMATMADSTIKGRALGGGTGAPQDLTKSQVDDILRTFYTRLTNLSSTPTTLTLQDSGKLITNFGANRTVNLPQISAASGAVYILQTNSGNLTISPFAGDGINLPQGFTTSATTLVPNGAAAAMILSNDGGSWSAQTYPNYNRGGTGSVQRGLQSKLSDWVSALDFAVGDCSTDDSTAIQSAINSLTNGGTVYFPPAPGGCYAIGTATTITLPATKAITLMGAGRGDATTSAGTVLKATAVLSGGVINTAIGFIRGIRISSMTILGNAQAAYCLKMDNANAGMFDNLNLYDCTTINFRLGDGTHVTQENTVLNIRLDNPITTVLANLPVYNFELNGTNNDIINVKAANAKTANIHMGSTNSGNKYVNIHGYDFFSGAAQAPVNNILIDGSNEQIVSCEMDGSSSANMQINGFGNVVSNCLSQFQGLTAQIGINIATTFSGNNINNSQFLNSTTANTIVQAGTAGAPGNFYSNNYNGTQGTTSLTRTIVASTVANLPGCSARFEGSFAGVTDANAPAYNSIVAGGGAVRIPVYCDGTNWRSR